MLKLKYIFCEKNNQGYFTFYDEFSLKTYGGKSFFTLDEAVSYARENIIYKGNPFDLVSINKPEYQCISSIEQWDIDHNN